MKLYIIGNTGIFGDAYSHLVPTTVEVVPIVDAGIAYLNGEPIGISDGKFAIANPKEGFNELKIGDAVCEPLFCITTNSVSRIHAIGTDPRAVLPMLERIEALEKTVARHDSQLATHDIFT